MIKIQKYDNNNNNNNNNNKIIKNRHNALQK